MPLNIGLLWGELAMSENKDKPPQYKYVLPPEDVSARTPGPDDVISPYFYDLKNAVYSAYADLKGTFTVSQKSLVQKNEYEDKMTKLVDLAEKTLETTNKQLEEARHQAKTERNRYYIALIVAVISIVVGVTVTLLR